MEKIDYAKLSIEELVELCKSGTPRERELAMEQIITQNDNLILHLINKYYSSYRHRYIEDMRQEGREAMFLHATDYDPEKGMFSTFITPYIIDAIKTYICSIHGISTHYSGQIKRFNKAIEVLRRRGIEHPTFGDIAEEMGVGIDAVQRVHEIVNHMNPISIEGDEKDKELTSPYDSSPDTIYEREEEIRSVSEAVNSLPSNERKVIMELFFRDSGNRETPLIDVANRLNMDVSTVRRLKNLALHHLQEARQLSDHKVTKNRRKLNDFSQGLCISFTIPAEVVNADIEIALSLDADEYEEVRV